MQLLSLISFATAALAFTIPEGQPEGSYAVSIVNGKEIHTLLPRGPASDIIWSAPNFPRRSTALTKRQSHCLYNEEGGLMNAGDTNAAVQNLIDQCNNGNGVPPSRSYYSIRGCTVAYVCNFDRDGFDGNYNCSGDSVPHGLRSVTATCGRYAPGWDQTGNISVGYENHCSDRGAHFCGDLQ